MIEKAVEPVEEVKLRYTVVFLVMVVSSVEVRPVGAERLVVVELPCQALLLDPAETGLPSVEPVVVKGQAGRVLSERVTGQVSEIFVVEIDVVHVPVLGMLENNGVKPVEP